MNIHLRTPIRVGASIPSDKVVTEKMQNSMLQLPKTTIQSPFEEEWDGLATMSEMLTGNLFLSRIKYSLNSHQLYPLSSHDNPFHHTHPTLSIKE